MFKTVVLIIIIVLLQRKLLAIYLHHDNSVLTNVFCTQLLGFETVLQLLSANFVVWGWDFTFESNKQKYDIYLFRYISTIYTKCV